MFSFRLLPLFLAAAVGLCPFAPPEHLHEATDSDGHHHQVAHRHTLLHMDDEDHDHAGDHGQGGDEAVHVEDADHAHTVYVDSVFTIATAVTSVAAPAVVGIPIQEPRVERGVLPPSFVDELIHGPPRASPDLRGPPSLPFL